MIPPPPSPMIAPQDIRAALVGGVVRQCCACSGGSGLHWRMPDGEHVAVHERCVDRLIEEWGESSDVAAIRPSGRPTGAYARRAGRIGESAQAAPRAASRSLGSPWWRPGMAEGTPWVVAVDTNVGRRVSISADERHAVGVLERWRLLTEKHGQPIDLAGTVACGATLVDPRGQERDRWGVIDLATPRWAGVTRTRDWTTCPRCDEVLWPLRLVGVEGGRCRACMEAGEAADPRVWPDEPSEPPMESADGRPEHLGGLKRRKTKTKSKEAS